MNRKLHKKQRSSAEDQVLKALSNSRYKYRTVGGLARETRLDAQKVKQILDSSNSVRKSLVRSKAGSQLYASKTKVSVPEDLWVAFRALNSAKFGS